MYQSPLGELLLVADEDALVGLYMAKRPAAGWRREDGAEPFAETSRQLTEYFAGKRRTFDLPLRPAGTEFQMQVWRELAKIPYGETITYGEQTSRLGLLPEAARAVGTANGQNPISIVVPCHRVIGADGKLAGYSGGLERKRRLLDLESSERRLFA